jgi:competence protein ComFB
MNTVRGYSFDNLINEAERLVAEELERQLKDRTDMCTCEDCVLDMAAWALNHVKPYYRVSLIGSLYAHAVERTDYTQQVKKAVKDAVTKIKTNPSHD